MMSQQDHAQVKIIPPLIPLGFIIIGWLLGKYVYDWPIPISQKLLMPVAYVVMLSACSAFVLSLYFFFKTRQNPEPRTPTNKLYTAGIYRITRNPIYLGFVLAQIVVAIKWNNSYILMSVPLVIFFLNRWVIKAEEEYLQRIFGEKYLIYKQKVRRWI